MRVGLLVVADGETPLILKFQSAWELGTEAIDDFAYLALQVMGQSRFFFTQLGQMVLRMAQQHRKNRGGGC
ncbi:hypothetical protein D3C73_1584440 [compost metagenome]